MIRPILIAILLHALLQASLAVVAQPKQQTDNFLSPDVYKTMEEIHALIDTQAYDEAERQLTRLFEKRRLSTFERAMVWRTRGYIGVQQDDYDRAIEAFETALALEVIEPEAANEMRFNIGQLHMAQDRIAAALPWLEQWREAAAYPTGQALMTLASAYAQLDRNEEALDAALSAINVAPPGYSDWYNFAAAMQMFLDRYDQATDLLQRAVLLFPEEKELWVRLASAYVEMEQTDKALAVAQLAAEQGLWREGDQRKFLAQLYLNVDLPYPGAETLDDAFEAGLLKRTAEDLELLSSAWLMARERTEALPALQTAAEAAEDGELFYRLGQYQLADENWDAAIESFQAALNKGGLDKPARVHMALGIALTEVKNYEAARKAFRAAARDPETAREARTWLADLSNRS